MIDNEKKWNSRFENSRDSGGDVFENGNGSHNGHHQITNNHQNSAGNNGFGEFGEIDCPVVPGFQSPIKGDDLAPFCGRNRGIQVIYSGVLTTKPLEDREFRFV